MSEYFLCPHCEAKVRAGALACPECGSDESTGWSRSPAATGLFPQDEEERQPSAPRASNAWIRHAIVIVAALLIASFLVTALPSGIYVIPIVLLAVVVLYYLAGVRPGRNATPEEELYQRLLQQALGDTELVERVIEHERKRNPRATRAELLQDALYRWRRDRQ